MSRLAEVTIIDNTEKKKLVWYGHMHRMDAERWPNLIWKCMPPTMRKRGPPKTTWEKGLKDRPKNRGYTKQNKNGEKVAKNVHKGCKNSRCI